MKKLKTGIGILVVLLAVAYLINSTEEKKSPLEKFAERLGF